MDSCFYYKYIQYLIFVVYSVSTTVTILSVLLFVRCGRTDVLEHGTYAASTAKHDRQLGGCDTLNANPFHLLIEETGVSPGRQL